MRPAQGMRRWHPLLADVAAGALLLVLCLVFFWQVLTPDALNRRWFARGDFTDQFYAFRSYQAQALWNGRLPLWNPYTLSGSPFLADIQSAVYYPVGLLVVLLAGKDGLPLFAVEVEVIAHFFLASFFTFLFVKRLTGNRLAGLVSGIVYAYGSYLTSYPKLQMAILEGQTWVPLALLAVHHAGAAERQGRRTRSLICLMLGGAALSLSALAGHGQTFLLASYTVMAYLVFSFYDPLRALFSAGRRAATRGEGWGLVARMLVLPLVALGLSAAQWIPSLEYMLLSTRSQIAFSQAGEGFLYNDLLSLILPGTRLLYAGVLPLLLAVWALVAGRRRETCFWGVTALIALLLSLGERTAVYMFLYLLAPGFSLFQGQQRALQVFSLAMAILAGLGTALLDGPMARPAKRRFAGLVRVLLWANAGALVFALLALLAAENLSPPQPGEVNGLLERSVLLLVLLVPSTLVLYLRLRHKLRGWRLGALVLPLIVFDLFTLNYGSDLARTRARDRFEVTAAVQFLQAEPGPFRVWDDYVLRGNAGMVWGLEMTSGVSPLHLRRYDDLLNEVPGDRVRQLLNARYAFTWEHELPDGVWVEAYSDPEKDFYFHRIEEPGAAAYMVHRVEIEPDAARALQRLADPAFDPQHVALLSDDVGLSPGGTAQSTVRWVERRPERLQLEVETGADGILVLSEIHYPGWQARVDGERVAVLRAQYTLRAVPLSAGKHLVELTYRPWTVALGLVISGLTLAAVVAGVVWLRRRNS